MAQVRFMFFGFANFGDKFKVLDTLPTAPAHLATAFCACAEGAVKSIGAKAAIQIAAAKTGSFISVSFHFDRNGQVRPAQTDGLSDRYNNLHLNRR